MSLSSKKTVPFIHDKNMDDLKGKKKKKRPEFAHKVGKRWKEEDFGIERDSRGKVEEEKKRERRTRNEQQKDVNGW